MSDLKDEKEIEKMLELLSQIPEAPLPDVFDLRLRRALKEESKNSIKVPVKKRTVWKRWGSVAAVFAIGLLSVTMMQEGLHLENFQKDLTERENTNYQEIEQSFKKVTPKTEAITKNSEETKIKSGAGSNTNERSKNSETVIPMEEKSLPIQNVEEKPTSPQKIPQPQAYLAVPEGQNNESVQVVRGVLPSEARLNFDRQSEETIKKMAMAIQENDADALFSACNGKKETKYTESQAKAALSLYQDIFTTKTALTYKKMNITESSYHNLYQISNNINTLLVVVKNGSNGVEIYEPLLSCGEWLTQQLFDIEFTLLSFVPSDSGEQIEFKVRIDSQGNGYEKDEIRSFVWKENESL